MFKATDITTLEEWSRGIRSVPMEIDLFNFVEQRCVALLKYDEYDILWLPVVDTEGVVTEQYRKYCPDVDHRFDLILYFNV